MNRLEFITALDKALSVLPPAEAEKASRYYQEIFDDRLEEGISEEEVVSGLEPVDTIAQRIIDETPMHALIKDKARSIRTGSRVLNIVLLVLGFPLWFPLLMTILMVILSFYFVIWSLILALLLVVLALGLAALAGVFGSPFVFASQSLAAGLLSIGCGLASGGLAILAFYPALCASRALIRLTVWIARKIRQLFLRKEVS